jgi:hypothetical protein
MDAMDKPTIYLNKRAPKFTNAKETYVYWRDFEDMGFGSSFLLPITCIPEINLDNMLCCYLFLNNGEYISIGIDIDWVFEKMYKIANSIGMDTTSLLEDYTKWSSFRDEREKEQKLQAHALKMMEFKKSMGVESSLEEELAALKASLKKKSK